MLDALGKLSNQLPPRLKALLNLTITLVLVAISIPLLWSGIATGSWSDGSLGAGLLLLGIFNLFT
jgi:hypothetical protein